MGIDAIPPNKRMQSGATEAPLMRGVEAVEKPSLCLWPC